jgi:hypothetical protein
MPIQKAQISLVSSSPSSLARHAPVRQSWRLIYYRPSDQGLKVNYIHFNFFEGALTTWLQLEKQNIREQSAWSKLSQINRRLLTCIEDVFICKLQKSKCLNITKRQYGYLSGIYERQFLN